MELVDTVDANYSQTAEISETEDTLEGAVVGEASTLAPKPPEDDTSTSNDIELRRQSTPETANRNCDLHSPAESLEEHTTTLPATSDPNSDADQGSGGAEGPGDSGIHSAETPEVQGTSTEETEEVGSRTEAQDIESPSPSASSLPTVEDAEPEPQKQLNLLSLRFSRNYELWQAFGWAVVSASLYLMYWFGLVYPKQALQWLRVLDGEWNLFFIALTGTITSNILMSFILTSFEKLRWKLTLRDEGVPLLTFMIFSRHTHWWTLVKFLGAPRRSKPHIGRGIDWIKSFMEPFRLYSLFRLTLWAVALSLTVILCADMDINPLYLKKGNIFPHHGGTIAVNFSLYYADSDAIDKQLLAGRILGAAHSGSGGMGKSLVLQEVEYLPQTKDPKFRRLYKGNLLPVIVDYSLNEIRKLNATSQDFVTSYRAPFYGVEVLETPDHISTSPRIYGCGTRAVIVSAENSNSSEWMLAGYGAIDYVYKKEPDGEGRWASELHSTVGFHIRIRQYFADMTFPLLQFAAPVLIENVIKGNYIHMPGLDYQEVLSLLYPKSNGPSLTVDTAACQLYLIADSLMRNPVHPTIWELYLLPFLAQQNGYYKEDHRAILETSIVRQSYQVSANIRLIWLFFALSLSVVLCCTVISYFAGSTIPETTEFPEFDLGSKFKGTDQEGIKKFAEISRLIQGDDKNPPEKTEIRNLPKTLAGYTVRVQSEDQWVDTENRRTGAYVLGVTHEPV